jgi:hypothetical protein
MAILTLLAKESRLAWVMEQNQVFDNGLVVACAH